ncbi:PadR family transcriptional regulator [Streptomonospora litoralis]|uniref:Transcriptional regulator YqjI n=1 Tax=Streptomonospora litoralis TaxID=2498135 RepID=A0A4P6PX95_9ACTN|nr:Transcriptional regulator YqjI [Streptomonospora litoralis]
MSTIFGHGRLRLYLLKLLDESPRHGYEIISLLRDRFLGVYSPSPGTIYPRLARLEEEGLVTHEEVDGRKVYRLTDRGREELRNRSADLDDLEREITDSVRDVAEAVREDVRDTISSLREELKFGGSGRRSRGEGARTGAADGASGARTAGEGTSAGSGDSPRGGTEDEGAERGGSWWSRDWERFTQGFGTWTKRSGEKSGGERAEFDQALRDFSDRVRGVVREAGQVGESAAHDLRRILDETFETIRRDVGGWGPRDTDHEGTGGTGQHPCGGRSTADHERGPGRHGRTDEASGSETPGDGRGAAAPNDGGDSAGAANGESGGPRASDDPWSAAVDDPTQRPGTGPSGPSESAARGPSAGPAEQTGQSAGPADEAGGPNRDTAGSTGTGDPWSTAVNDDGESDERRGGPGA